MPDAQSWTWVKDLTTGDLYDIPTARVEACDGHVPGLQVVAAKAPHYGRYPRRSKRHIDLANRTAAKPASGPDTDTSPSTGEGTDAAEAAADPKE